MKKILILSLTCIIIFTCFAQAGIITNAAVPVLPQTGAYDSGVYRNLFAEAGKKDAQIQAKIDSAFKQLFYGSNDTQRLYYPVEPDMAYILDVAHDDVRSEGMSYGMMICIQLNKQEEFNRLWKWSRTNMYQSSGPLKGFFAWQCDKLGKVIDDTPASDGDEYFLMSLLFAENRWGNGTGIFNYHQEALNIMDAMLHQSDDGQGVNMFDKSQKQIAFCPEGESATFTDPSYHLPAFYELWALWGEKDNQLWKDIAATSREFFKKTTNATTGLGPDYANFDGSPKEVTWSSGHGDFRFDAWRIASNIAVDYAWWAKDSWQNTFADRIQNFFYNQGLTSYGNNFSISGSKLSSDHSPGLVAMNAVASLAATQPEAYDFVNELWNLSIPSGQYRYYDGMLYMLGLLHVSCNFRIWKPSPVQTPTITPTTSPNGTGDLNNDGAINISDVMLVASVFNSARGDSRYVEAYDLNGDGAVNISDVMVIAEKFNTMVKPLELYAVKYGESPFLWKYIFKDMSNSGETTTIAWAYYMAKYDNKTILFDTGFRDESTASQWGVKLFDMENEVNKIGNGPDAVDVVFITHSHIDHIANLDLYKKAAIVISKKDYDSALNQCTQEVKERLLRDDTIVVEDEYIYDGRFKFKVTGGHTEGSAVVYFGEGINNYVLTGDECYTCDNLLSARPIGGYFDTLKNELFIKDAHEKNLIPLPCHDIKIFKDYSHVSDNIVRIL